MKEGGRAQTGGRRTQRQRRDNAENMAAAPETGKQSQFSTGDKCKSLMQIMKNLSNKGKNGVLSIYSVSMEFVMGQKIFEFGTAKPDKKNKVIMMVGETGSGKTTLINTMINYIFGVEWKDDHRIQLIDESSGRSQAHSQTSSVTIYQINHEDDFRIPYSITILDTPGFGDTRGINYDEKIMRKMREFFHKCKFTEIDAICFVVQSTLARLTPTQVYIYDNILSIFGKDIKENIVFFTTFADVQEPNVLSAIIEADVPCAQSEDGRPVFFKVNNSMVYANNRPNEADDGAAYKAHEIQWQMGMKSIEEFLLHFLPGLTGKDLSLTKEVLAERNSLEIILDGLVQKIQEVMFKRQELLETEKQITQHKKEIERDESFLLVVTKLQKVKIDSSVCSTNCTECRSTCHHDCLVYFNSLVYFCEVFNRRGRCRVCGHSSKMHVSEKSYWETTIESKMLIYLAVKEKYEKEAEKSMTPENVLIKLKEEIKEAEEEALKLIKKVAKILKRLQEIALKPNPMSAVDYIRLLIETERREAKSGFMDRIRILQKAIKRFVVIGNIQSQGESVQVDNILSEEAAASEASDTSE